MEFVDTHAHLYLDAFQHDLGSVIERARQKNIVKIYMPNIDETTLAAVVRTAQAHPTLCFPMLGIHPCAVRSHFEPQLHALEAELGKASFAAVGEIGMDLYRDRSLHREQQEAFAFQVDLAKKQRLPLSIHCRNGFKELLQVLERAQDGSLQGVVHCFTGTPAEAAQCIELGFFLGVGGIATLPNNALVETIAAIALEHWVLETDSPYLAPVPHRGKRNEPAYLVHTAEKIAAIKGIALEEVARVTTKNAERAFHGVSR